MISASAVGTPAVKTSAEAALPAPAEASSASISSKPGEKALTRNTGVAASFGDALRARIDAETEAGGGAPTLQMPATPVANLTGPPLNDVVGWQRMRGQSTSRAVKLDASTQPLDQTQGGAATATALVPAASGHSPSHTLGSTLAAATTAPVPTPQFPPAPSVTAAAISVAAATSQTDARKAEPVANTGVATARITTISRSAANSRPAPERATTGVARVADSRAAPQAAVQAATTGAARVADAPKTALQAPSTKAVVTPTISSGRANRAAASGRALTAQAPQDAAADSNAVGAKPASPAPRAGDAGLNDAALHDLAANDASASDDSDVSAAPPAVSADVASGVAPLPALHVAAPERQSAALVQVDAPGQAAHALHASAVGPTQEAAAATPTPQARQTLVQALGEHLQVQIANGSQNAVIRLDPASMGSIDIVIRHEAGAVQVHLTASNSEVVSQLQGIGDALRQDLSQRHQGAISVQVSDGSRDANGRQRQGGGEQPAPGRALSEADGGEEAATFDWHALGSNGS